MGLLGYPRSKYKVVVTEYERETATGCGKRLVKMVYLILIHSAKSAILKASISMSQHKSNEQPTIQWPSRNIHKTPE